MNRHAALSPHGPLPEGRGVLFLSVRRGLPLAVASGTLLIAAQHEAGRGWWVLAGVIALATVWRSFLRGGAFLQHRHAIMRQDGLWAQIMRPLARVLGFEDAWIQSFCSYNNQRVRETFRTRRARRVLVLLPHCIQMARCKAPVLDDLQTCYDCGLCSVGDYSQAALLHRWETRISNRSHKAYREAREYRPDLIVAVSCSDRLIKGLTKLPEIPSYVIPLELPHGMCVDTDFSMPHLLAAMEALAEPRKLQSEVQPLRREGIA